MTQRRRFAMRSKRLAAFLALAALALASLTFATAAMGQEAEVTVGSIDTEFSQNKQNEPAVALNANNPLWAAAGANDNIDMELCNAGPDNDCPFTEGVGVSGISFSFDGGKTWTQPNYPGYSARTCVGTAGTDTDPCVPLTPTEGGQIGTLPKYYENGLVSDGDPAVAWGPRQGANGAFSWANGSRLYYANLTSNFPGQQGFKGAEAIGVSWTDDPEVAAAGGAAGWAAWHAPVIASKQSSATFSDKEQIWADNASSSPFFGNVYICHAHFVGNPAQSIHVSVSRDGGNTWTNKKVTPASDNFQHFGRSGCTIRTTSDGVTYVFYEEANAFTSLPPHGSHFYVVSTDGGSSWSRPQKAFDVTDPCFNIDPNIARCVEDGWAGARNDLAASPSIDIANGAPTGAGATNEIVDAWADGSGGLNNENVLVATKLPNGGWHGPFVASTGGDRGYYAAPAISPTGDRLYLTYNAFTTPFQANTSAPRNLIGVVKTSSAVLDPTTGSWSTLHRTAGGDPRASSQNNLVAEFLGDYVYTAAANVGGTNFAVGVWNDVRAAADCPAIDAFRLEFRDAVLAGTVQPEEEDLPEIRAEGGDAEPHQEGEPEAPAPNYECPDFWGNSDIWSYSNAP
jgi:hypothetical protein